MFIFVKRDNYTAPEQPSNALASPIGSLSKMSNSRAVGLEAVHDGDQPRMHLRFLNSTTEGGATNPEKTEEELKHDEIFIFWVMFSGHICAYVMFKLFRFTKLRGYYDVA